MAAIGQHRVARDQQAVSHRHVGSLLAMARRDPPELGCEISVFGVRGGPGRFAHGAPQPLVAFAGATTAPFSGALSSCPGHSVAQLARWAALGYCVMSAPISATILQPLTMLIPRQFHPIFQCGLSRAGRKGSTRR